MDEALAYDNGSFQDRPPYLCLEEVLFYESIRMVPETLLLPFLRICPALKRLSLPVVNANVFEQVVDTIASNCPLFTSIQIMQGVFTDEELKPIFRSSKLGLETFEFLTDFDSTDTRLVKDLISHWTNTLTSVVLSYKARFVSDDIQALLSSLPHLKIFCAKTTYTRFERHVSKYTHLKLRDVVKSQWVCNGLEELSIVFEDERTERTTAREYWDQEKQTRLWIKKAYEQIGRLTRLRKLDVGWRTVFRIERHCDESRSYNPRAQAPVAHLDLSMKSGLSLLGGLKDLRLLSIGALWRSGLEEQEMKWIVENWPRLEGVSGLNRMNRQWLREQKPGIKVLACRDYPYGSWSDRFDRFEFALTE